MNEVPPTASTTSDTSSKAASSGSTLDTPLSASSTKTSSFRAGTRASSIASSWRKRRPSFHVTSFALSVACKLLTVHRPPPPLRLAPPSSALPSSAPSMLSLVDSVPAMKPLKVYGDIIGPQLCKVVLVLKELGLPYVLKVFDHSSVDKDSYAPTALTRAVPALDDPNKDIILWEVSIKRPKIMFCLQDAMETSCRTAIPMPPKFSDSLTTAPIVRSHSRVS